MKKTEEMKRFEAELKASEELRKKYEETCERIAKAGGANSDGEVMTKAAAELGYDISIADLERSIAGAQELDLDELENVAGGIKDDEDGNEGFCITAWHCFTAMLHTDAKERDLACWSDYKCVVWSN